MQLNSLVDDKDKLSQENANLKEKVSLLLFECFRHQHMTNLTQLAEIMKKLDTKTIEAEKLEERLKDLQQQQQMITQNLLEVNKAAQLVAAQNRVSMSSMVGDENKQNPL